MPKLKYFLNFGVLLAIGCASAGTGVNFFSYQQEQAEGAKYAGAVEKEVKLVNDSFLHTYITNLGHKIISKGAVEAKFQYVFKVVDSAELNAFAIPGGYLYVNLGLLKAAESEAELVGVLGHEVGHVIHRHGTQKMSDAMLLQMIAVGAASATGEKAGQYVGLGVMLFGNIGLLNYGRNAELESDKTGIDILYAMNYDVNAMAGFFKKLLAIERQQGAERGGLSDMLSTHPASATRIEAANSYVATLSRQINPVISSEEFQDMKNYIAPMRATPGGLTKKSAKALRGR